MLSRVAVGNQPDHWRAMIKVIYSVDFVLDSIFVVVFVNGFVFQLSFFPVSISIFVPFSFHYFVLFSFKKSSRLEQCWIVICCKVMYYM